MKLTTKGRYAVTALLDLTLQGEGSPISISEIANRHGISSAYLERLAGQMRAKGLLKSSRGPKGGYVLGRPAEEITVADIIESVNEGMDATQCRGKGNCQAGAMCLTHHLWDELNREILGFLKGITLRELAVKPAIMAISKQCDSKIEKTREHHESAVIF